MVQIHNFHLKRKIDRLPTGRYPLQVATAQIPAVFPELCLALTAKTCCLKPRQAVKTDGRNCWPFGSRTNLTLIG